MMSHASIIQLVTKGMESKMFKYKKQALKEIILQGAAVYNLWFNALPDMKSDEQMAGIAREALPVLSKMNDFIHQHGWKKK